MHWHRKLNRVGAARPESLVLAAESRRRLYDQRWRRRCGPRAAGSSRADLFVRVRRRPVKTAFNEAS
jgi:hypothetical protein